MRERINRLAKGIIDMETPVMTVDPSVAEEEIKAGERIRRELLVTCDNQVHGKGLVYSSSSRVRVLTPSFGGLRSHIGYEIDSRYLEYGDMIEGSFYLVTNSGEKEIPYSFRVAAGNSGKILSQLKTPKDFAALARKDYDLALRLFEFRDFTEAPFMQDMHIRAIYDGLHGQGSRFGQLEQFFIALDIKAPVKLGVEKLYREYYAPDGVIADEVEIKKEGWGYLPITVRIEGGFIQSIHKTISDEDFTGGLCRFPYEINPAALHGGKNYGSIILETMYETIKVVIEAHGMPEREKMPAPKRYARYLSLRLEYQAGREGAEQLKGLMEEELEQLRMSGGQSAFLSLLQGELMAALGKYEEAKTYLEECSQQVYQDRMEKPGWYCMYEYAYTTVYPDQERREALKRLLGKYMDEGQSDYLLFYLYTQCDENWCFENPADLLSQMKVLYGEGCRSPFLYQQALEIWNQMPQLLYGIGAMELQALNYGAKRQLVCLELAVKAARLSGVSRHSQPLCCRMLKRLYEHFQSREILEAVCSLMIRSGCQKEADFVWYDRAVQQQLSLTRLYEHFLYSLPRDYSHAIPRQVLLYFSYEHDLDRKSREVLYENMIRYVSKESSLYQEYEMDISRFAVEQVLESRINRRLAVIYNEMIYPDMVDSAIARVLPALLKSYRISCRNPLMKYVVVCYEELTEETVHPLENGVAYVPIFSREVSILFQDAYGNRYTQIGFVKTRAMDKPELEKRCFELDPEHPMLLLEACKEEVSKETIDQEGKKLLEQALSQLPLHPLYRRELTWRLIQYYQSCQKEEARILPLLAADAPLLSSKQRSGLCRVLICHEYMEEAYHIADSFKCQVEGESLKNLCVSMILGRMFDENELLLSMAFQVYEAKQEDAVILDYLCEHFNGTCGQMYGILVKSVKEQVETGDMEERLLAQMMFTGQVSRLDQVFAFYVTRKKAGESIVRAYFTIKSAEYFLHDVPAADKVFDYLETMLSGAVEKGKVSTIYLLALSRYYSTLPSLNKKQRQLCQVIVDQLLEDGMVFSYFKQLAGQIRIPEEILDKAIIQYVGQKDSKVELRIRILPNEEQFHRDDIRRVYQGIFVKQKVLFEGEIMEYEIYEQREDGPALVKEGSVACELRDRENKKSRFSLLNQMALCLNLKEEDGLKEAMEEYVKKTAAVEELFRLQ